MSREQTPTSFLYTAESASLAAKMIIFMKRLLLLFAALIGFSAVASAQIGYNDVQFYVEAGKSWDTIGDYEDVRVVISIDGDVSLYKISKFLLRDSVDQGNNILQSPQYIVNLSSWHGHANRLGKYKKDYDYSTSSQTVYVDFTPGSIIEHGWGRGRTVTNDHYDYFSLSSNGNVLKKYYGVERKGDLDSYDTYVKIDKNDLKPKASNSEFYD